MRAKMSKSTLDTKLLWDEVETLTYPLSGRSRAKLLGGDLFTQSPPTRTFFLLIILQRLLGQL